MIVRTLTMVGALAGGAGLSQFPEYAQQYEQRLAGAVDEMRVVVQKFDTSIAAAGQTREEVFAKTEGSELEMRLVGDGKSNIDRLSFLETSLARLQNAPVLTQLVSAPLVADTDVARAAYADFKPAVPLTMQGIACAVTGFIVAWFSLGGIMRLLSMVFGSVFRRKKPA